MNNQFSLFTAMDNTTPPAAQPVQNEPVAKADAKDLQKEKPAKKNAGKGASSTKVRAKISAAELDTIHFKVTTGLKTYFSKSGHKKAVLGLSGGVDSALTLKIAVDALGAENVTAVIMPELGLTNQENIDHAKILCQFLQVNCYYQPINNFITDFNITPWRPGRLAHMNTKARIRGVLLYSIANTETSLVLGTSNKSELLLGYGTKYGDLAADVEVIGDLLKTEVVKLADHVGLPPEIVNKTPTAELAPGQTDASELGASYEELDKVLAKIELGEEGCIADGLPEALVRLVFKRMNENKHKVAPPFVIKAK